MMEVDKTVDTGREQRRAEARAMQRGWQARVICGILERDLFWSEPEGGIIVLDRWYDGGCVDGGPSQGRMEDDDGQPTDTDEGTGNDR